MNRPTFSLKKGLLDHTSGPNIHPWLVHPLVGLIKVRVIGFNKQKLRLLRRFIKKQRYPFTQWILRFSLNETPKSEISRTSNPNSRSLEKFHIKCSRPPQLFFLQQKLQVPLSGVSDTWDSEFIKCWWIALILKPSISILKWYFCYLV